MSTALEAASLIMIPTSYSDGLLASVKPNDGAGDFTFSRGSNLSATRVNADGNIEKGYENLLLQSNSFTTTWTNFLIDTPTSGQEGYDGTNDAWLIECSNTSNFNGVRQPITTTGVTTLSVYAKAGTTNFLGFFSSAGFGGFELTGVGTTGQLFGNAIDSKIELISNGWYRCSIVLNGNASAVFIGARSSINSFNAAIGDNVYIQDAMLNQGLVAYPYVETTTAPVAGGILEDMPRIDFSEGNQSLLLEPSRTNETPHSEYYDVFLNYGTGKCTFTPNAAISPEGFQNSFKAVLNSNQQNGGGAISTRMRRFTQGAIITFSMFFKADEFDQVILGGFFQNESATFNLKDGSVVSQASNVIDAYSIPFGNGWYRCVVTYTFQDGIGNGYLYSGFRVVAISDGVSSVGDGVKGLFAYGVQFEEATYPTSYIPTYGVSQTRLADFNGNDNIVSTPISFGANDDFTLYYEGSFAKSGDQGMIMGGGALGASASSRSYWWVRGSDLYLAGDGQTAIATASFNAVANTNYKLLVKRNGSVLDFFVNGAKLTTNQSNPNTPFTFRSLGWSYNNSAYKISGDIKQALIFTEALSDEECITLTTI